ncbi:bifunctional precorrin-2 dehydrogenase/sirohydrochlorin ferrochelatase [bacterium]|nr:bifunctional precorrin-2 dehydrogenase/sirohydrochlorin ferrochelatase [bacterium]
MFLPLIFRGDRLRTLVIGGGDVAQRKVDDLLHAGVTVAGVAPRVTDSIMVHIKKSDISWRFREYKPGDCRGYGLIVVATNSGATNLLAYQEAKDSGIPVNVVDRPDLCTVYFSAVVRDDPLLLSISTGGSAPFFARETRKSLENWVEENKWGLRARYASDLRRFTLEHVDSHDIRNCLYDRLMKVSNDEIESWKNLDSPTTIWRKWMSELEKGML